MYLGLLARWGLFSYIMTVVIHPQRKLRNHAHKESNPYFTKNYLNYVTQDTTAEMMEQLLRSIFTTVWGEEIKTPGTYREQGC